jgi:hypothetical protein
MLILWEGWIIKGVHGVPVLSYRAAYMMIHILRVWICMEKKAFASSLKLSIESRASKTLKTLSMHVSDT